MAAPNILSLNKITGNVAYAALATSNTSLLSNASSSGKVMKINNITISNKSTGSVNVSVHYFTQASMGGDAIPIVYGTSVPPNSTLVALDKLSSIYLEENRSIGANSSASGTLSAIISYDELS
jgi:hypothetical protein